MTGLGMPHRYALYANDGSKMDIYVANNRLLPSRITDSNGNFITMPTSHSPAIRLCEV